MEPPPAPPEQQPAAAALVCVVCATAVGPGDAVCPRCDEPRVRICKCSTFVDLDQRACPACGLVIPRVLSMEIRSKRRWRRRMWIGAAAVGVLIPAGLLLRPAFQGARQAATLLAEGEAALRAGRAEEARQKLAAYAAKRPPDGRVQLLCADAAFRCGDIDGGVTWVRRALLADTNLAGAHVLLARALAAAGRWTEALPYALRAAEPEGRRLAADALAAMGRLDAAARAFETAIAAAPADLDLKRAAAAVHAELGAADWAPAAEHRARAQRLLEEVVRTGEARLASAPDNATAAVAVARAYAALPDATPEQIEQAFTQAAALAPDDGDLRADAAAALLRAGRPQAAVKALGPELRGRHSAAVWVRRARLLRDCGARDAAVAELRRALTADDGEPGPPTALARLEIDAGRAAEALATLSAARTAGLGDSAELWDVRADAALAAGDPESCVKVLSDWHAASPLDPRPLRRLLEVRMPAALAARRVRETNDASLLPVGAWLDELRALDPDDRAALYWGSLWDDASGPPEEAARCLDRLLALYPEDAEARVLRIRRAFRTPDARRGDPATGALSPATLAEELIGGAGAGDGAGADAPPSDVRAFVEEALGRGFPFLVIDVAAPALERTPGDAVLTSHLARALVAAGRPAAARAAIDAATEPVRSDPAVAALRSLAAALAGDVPDAAALAPATADLGTLLSAARVLTLSGRPADAAQVFGRARAACGGRPADLAQLAAALEDADRPDDARGAWDAVLEVSPRDLEAVSRGAIARLARGGSTHADDATEVAGRAGRLNSSQGGAADARAVHGAWKASLGADAAAAADLRLALAALPQRDDVRIVLARTLLHAGDAAGLAGARDEARAVVVRRPSSIPARRVLCESLVASAAAALAQGRLLAALDAFDELTALGVGAASHERSPLGIGATGLPPEAKARCLAVIQARPDDAGHRFLLALDAAARGAFDEADRLASDGIGVQPGLPGGPVVRGFVRGLAGRADDAARDITDARGRRAPGGDVALAEAAGLVKAGRPGGALPLIDAWAGAESAPRLRAAAAEARRADPALRDGALSVFADLLASAPREAAALGLHTWGRALAESGRRSDARRALRRALALAPADPTAAASREALANLR